MTIFANNMRIIFKSKIRVLVLLIVPIIFILMFVRPEKKEVINITIIDEDKTELSEILINKLSSNYNIISSTKDDIVNNLIKTNIHYAFVIPTGFTDRIIKGEDVEISGYEIQETNSSYPVKIYINNLINSVKNIGFSAGKDSEKFYEGLSYYFDGKLEMDYQFFKDVDKKRTHDSLGFLVQFMLYMSVIAAGLTLEEKRNSTFFRIFSAPVSIKRYMFENLLSALAIAILQVTVVFLFLKFYMNVYFGQSMLNMYLLFILFSVVCISMGTALTTITKTPKQAYLAIFLMTSPIVMLGGCYWPRDYMPDVLINVGNFVPTTWVMEGANKLLTGGNLASITWELVILLAFSFVFFLLGTLRKGNIMK